MANFVSLLKKTIDAQSNVTPQLRERIYTRARETIEKKLVGSNIAQPIIDQQFAMLEEAIASVEAEYQATERALLDAIIRNPLDEQDDREPDAPYEDVFEADPSYKEVPEQISSPEENATVPSHDVRDMVRRYEERTNEKYSADEENFEDDAQELIEGVSHNKASAPIASALQNAHAQDATAALVEPQVIEEATPKRKKKKGNFDAVVGIFKDAVERKTLEANKKQRKIFWGIAVGLITVIVVILALGWSLLYSSHKDDVGAGGGQSAVTTPAITEKMTQRLMPDGTETNPGPVEAQASPEEGKTVSPALPDEEREEPSKVVLYQAATTSATEKISSGNAKWNIVQEKSEDNQNEEEAIRGDIAIPDEDLLLRMTIRRNQDKSIPAAYVVEMIFVVPDNAKEGAVAEVRDLKFKGSEQMTGQSLAGTSYMKIGDNFFIFPISDVQPFTDSNLRLMRQLQWIRIVADFKSGRTMELTFSKGSEGEKIFKQVITHWLADENTSAPATSNH